MTISIRSSSSLCVAASSARWKSRSAATGRDGVVRVGGGNRPRPALPRALLAATHNELLERMEIVIETGLAERDLLVHGGEHPTTGAQPPGGGRGDPRPRS
ncbi:hypothetical protein [Streptosporangium vulgare]|uniref:hypothetical protein n=1 Tax=Streptosporangium vulgare TaxID=46190 RepID=UPI0031DB9B92